MGGSTQGDIVNALIAQPQQESTLRGVAEDLVAIQGSCTVDGDIQPHAIHLTSYLLHLHHLHLVLCECAGFVGTDNSGSTHRFAGMHTAHEVVGLQHTTHGIGQRERHRHGQALGDSHHDERDGNHEGLQQISEERISGELEVER